MTTKISCGGFDIDNDTLIEEDGVLKVKGGGSSGGGRAPMTVTISRSWEAEEEKYVYTADKTVDEMIEQIEAGGQLFSIFWNNMGSPVMLYQATEEGKGVVFRFVQVLSNKVSSINVSIRNTGSGDVISVQEFTYPST